MVELLTFFDWWLINRLLHLFFARLVLRMWLGLFFCWWCFVFIITLINLCLLLEHDFFDIWVEVIPIFNHNIRQVSSIRFRAVPTNKEILLVYFGGFWHRIQMHIMKPVLTVEALDHEDLLLLYGFLIVWLFTVAIKIIKVVRVMILDVFIFFFVLEGAWLEHSTIPTITPKVHPRIKFIAFVALMTSNHTPKTETVFLYFEFVADILIIEFHDKVISHIGVQILISIQDLLLVRC